MSVSLIPDVLLARYAQLTPEWLKKRGITLLLSDLDYTLAPKSVRRPDDELKNWISMLQAEGITMMIVSNNRSPKRVEEYCAELGISYQGHAGKPNPRGLYAAMAKAGAEKGNTAMLGDKLLTDVLAAHCAGVLSLMVEPVGGAVTPWQKVLHTLQKPFKAMCPEDLRKEV